MAEKNQTPIGAAISVKPNAPLSWWLGGGGGDVNGGVGRVVMASWWVSDGDEGRDGVGGVGGWWPTERRWWSVGDDDDEEMVMWPRWRRVAWWRLKPEVGRKSPETRRRRKGRSGEVMYVWRLGQMS
ncbi:hypothetical protein Tco_0490292 [Tanacetum coccineum]